MLLTRSVLGRRMNWINRYIDEPLLQGAGTVLKVWHNRTGQRPDTLEPVWHVLVIGFLMAVSFQCLTGPILLLSQGALAMLVLPSVRHLLRSHVSGASYDARDFKALRASAIDKRNNEWALRMAVLVGSVILPLAHPAGDADGTLFMLGASVWFALTAPIRFYLNAAEPPAPDEGDRLSRAAFGAAT
jgi:hypothetical protein